MSGHYISQHSGYTIHNRVKLVRGGRDYFSCLLELIKASKHSIHFQTYIFEEDETGEMVASALEKAADRGVMIYMMADGYASQKLSGSFAQRMKASGIRFRLFEPILKSNNYYFGRRLHQKVVVADAHVGLVAGVNISNRYNDMPGQAAWMDWAILVEGEAAVSLNRVCAEMWSRSPIIKRKALDSGWKPEIQPNWSCLVSVRRNDWVQRKNQISRTYLNMLKDSKDHIIMMSSYFLPGRSIRKGMSRAAGRGVKVSLILAGRSDIALAKHAERYLYRWLLGKGIKIYEYPSNVLHGKLAACDGKFVTGGSYNVNNLSAFASIELNLDVEDMKFSAEVETALTQIRDQECVQVTEEVYRTEFGWVSRVKQQAAYQLVRLMFFLFTFYFRQH